MTIIIDKDSIVEIKSGYVDAPSDTKIIDLKEHTVMPGLMDMHVHIEGELSPSRYVERFRISDADIALDHIKYDI